MVPIPEEWIEKLFLCMHEFYGDRWDNQFPDGLSLSLHKTIWKDGLCGLEYDQIKKTLLHYRSIANRYPRNFPPLVTDFYQAAISIKKVP